MSEQDRNTESFTLKILFIRKFQAERKTFFPHYTYNRDKPSKLAVNADLFQ